jgi:cell division protein FtsQ
MSRAVARPHPRPTVPAEHVAFAARRRRRRLRRWLLALVPVVLAVVVAVGMWAVFVSPLFAVTTVSVLGTHRTSPASVRLVVDVPNGQPLARVDVAAVQRRVESLPGVASATVTRSWPHTLLVTVVERLPVAAARTADGQWVLLDKTGVDLGSVSAQPPGLAVIDLDPSTADPATLRAAATVAAALGPLLRRHVQWVGASSPNGVELQLFGGAVVRWGSASQSTLKAQVLAALMQHRAAVYDVSAPDFPTTQS